MFVFTLEPLMSRGRVAFNDILLHNSCIHKNCSVKNALYLSNTKVYKIFTKYCDLSVSMLRSTCRFYRWNWRLVVIQVVNSSRAPISFFKCNAYWDKTRRFSRWRSALNIVIWNVFSWKNLFSKFTLNHWVFLEIGSNKDHISSTVSWALPWLKIKYIWRFIIVVKIIVICKLLIV